MAHIEAAGTVPWRQRHGRIEVALVHRPKYDDWGWPKGKLDPGETWVQAAVRETYEETGLEVRLGQPLPTNRYRLGRHDRKEVRYWAAQVVGGHGRLENEIDEVRWTSTAKARRLLTSRRDLEQLRALVTGPHATRSIVVVRHAHAVPRKEWTGPDDRLRPLDDAGLVRARELSGILRAYGVREIHTSPSTRCVDTLAPFRDDAGTPAADVHLHDALSEEGFAEDPRALGPVVRDAVAATDPVILCSHGPVLGPLLDRISGRTRIPSRATRRALQAIRRENLDKGEALVLHLGPGNQPPLVAVERHRP